MGLQILFSLSISPFFFPLLRTFTLFKRLVLRNFTRLSNTRARIHILRDRRRFYSASRIVTMMWILHRCRAINCRELPSYLLRSFFFFIHRVYSTAGACGEIKLLWKLFFFLFSLVFFFSKPSSRCSATETKLSLSRWVYTRWSSVHAAVPYRTHGIFKLSTTLRWVHNRVAFFDVSSSFGRQREKKKRHTHASLLTSDD